MEQTVYVDLYFLINFSMDFLCFFLLSKLLSLKLSFLRTLLASALGGVYACAALFLPVTTLPALIIDMAACILMCAVALLRPREVRRLLVCIPVYIAVSMVLGGTMTALFHLFNRLELPIENTDPDGISVWVFALLAIGSGLVTHLFGRFFSRRGTRREAMLEIGYEGRTRSLCALCDTGNLLRDPVGGKPCIVVDDDRLIGLLPSELLSAAKEGSPPSTALLARYRGRLRLIPAQSATGGGLLLAFCADRIRIDGKDGWHEVDALIVPRPLEGTAEALIPPELLL